jgi:very-short-patch-repair endonuclease
MMILVGVPICSLIGMRFIDRKRIREKRNLARELRQRSTPEERILWQHLRRDQIAGCHFRRQHVLSGFIVDFYCPAARLVVELDGSHHLDQREADEQRDAILQRTDILVTRFSNSEIRTNLPSVIKQIEEAVRARASRSVPPSPAVPLSRFRERGQG